MKIRLFPATFAVAMLIACQHVSGTDLGSNTVWDDFRPAAWEEEVAEPAADESLDECLEPGCGEDCCCPWACRTSCWQVFGELLYLRPRDAEVAYAVPYDGDGARLIAVQVGPVGVVDPDYEPGFRVGIGHALNDCASVAATYSFYESNTYDNISIDAGYVLRSLVVHPSTASASTDFLSSEAAYGIDFQLLDLDYRRIISCGELYSMNYLVGLRYAHLDQDFLNLSVDNGDQTVETGIEFDGGGIRLGWEGERHAPCSGLMIYGKATANFVAGDFKAFYFQGQSFDPAVVEPSWEAGRIITMLDLELGLGWVSPCGTCRVTGGYMVSSWYNTVKTNEWINAVRNNNFVGLGDTLTFDGLTLRAEVRF